MSMDETIQIQMPIHCVEVKKMMLLFSLQDFVKSLLARDKWHSITGVMLFDINK